MNDATRYGTEPPPADAANEEHREAVTAFCQGCGRALTSSSRRQVGTAIFCEPCVTAHAAPTPGWTPVNGANSTPYGYATPSAKSAEPNPGLAGFLGLIPGVGAMYNGQYPKSLLHLIIFVVLVSLADNLNWVFWWFVWGWIFYQAFDAYHTALARRDGQPLPDPFGWNELVTRLGGGRSWSPASHPPSHPPAHPRTTPGAPASSSAAGYAAPPPQAPASTPLSEPAPDPSIFAEGSAVPQGYAPDTPFESEFPRSGVGETFGYTAPTSIPYTPTFTGTPVAPPDLAPAFPSHRFPTAAAWLIGLGLLFLIGNLLPSWRLDGRWLVPLLLAAVAIWTGTRRLAALFRMRDLGGRNASPTTLLSRGAGALLGPAILMTLAVLLALQTGEILSLRHSWPVLLIVWGALLVMERARPGDRVGTATGSMDPPFRPE